MKPDIQPDNIIVVDNLVKKFGSFIANDHISFTVSKGEIFGFLGANGAGKTTTIRILCGLSKPTSGKVLIDQIDVADKPDLVKKRIGYMSQRFSLYEDLSIAQNLQLYGGIYGLSSTDIKERTHELLQRLDILSLKNRLISSIPLGWRQKLAFLVAIIHNPAVVFLDEPTGGVDPITRRQFWDLIFEASQAGVTIFVTTHYMDEAEYCNRVCILSNGVIKAQGEPEVLKRDFNADSIDEVFVRIARNPKK